MLLKQCVFFFFAWVENMRGEIKGEIIDYLHFLIYSIFFSKTLLCQGCYKSEICGEGLTECPKTVVSDCWK